MENTQTYAVNLILNYIKSLKQFEKVVFISKKLTLNDIKISYYDNYEIDNYQFKHTCFDYILVYRLINGLFSLILQFDIKDKIPMDSKWKMINLDDNSLLLSANNIREAQKYENLLETKMWDDFRDKFNQSIQVQRNQDSTEIGIVLNVEEQKYNNAIKRKLLDLGYEIDDCNTKDRLLISWKK